MTVAEFGLWVLVFGLSWRDSLQSLEPIYRLLLGWAAELVIAIGSRLIYIY